MRKFCAQIHFILFHRISQYFHSLATISKQSPSNTLRTTFQNQKHQTWKAKKEIITVWVVKSFTIAIRILVIWPCCGPFLLAGFSWFHDSLKFRIFRGFWRQSFMIWLAEVCKIWQTRPLLNVIPARISSAFPNPQSAKMLYMQIGGKYRKIREFCMSWLRESVEIFELSWGWSEDEWRQLYWLIACYCARDTHYKYSVIYNSFWALIACRDAIFVLILYLDRGTAIGCLVYSRAIYKIYKSYEFRF